MNNKISINTTHGLILIMLLVLSGCYSHGYYPYQQGYNNQPNYYGGGHSNRGYGYSYGNSGNYNTGHHGHHHGGHHENYNGGNYGHRGHSDD